MITLFKNTGSLIHDSFSVWWKSRPGLRGAALAFYTVFSLAPLFVIIATVFGFSIGRDVIQGQIVSEVSRLIGPYNARFVSLLIDQVSIRQSSLIASGISIALLVFWALTMFVQIQESLDDMWEVQEHERIGFFAFIGRWLSAILMVLGLGFLFVVSFGVSTAINYLAPYIQTYISHSDGVLQFMNFSASFILVSSMCVLIFRYLPSVDVNWRAAFFGGFVTGVLFIVGRFFIELYLYFFDVRTLFGPAAVLVIILLWVYYSSHTFFMGAAFTYTLDKRIHNGS